MATARKLPSRLHHTAYVSKNLEETRKFYEEIIGLPLMATWCESDMLFGAERTYCHLFFGLGDGGAFHHIALKVDADVQKVIEQRLHAAGYQEPKTFVLDHGYCRSLYAVDPDGMIVEFTVDHPDVEKINATRRTDAHSELKRWLAGDHTSNNTYR